MARKRKGFYSSIQTGMVGGNTTAFFDSYVADDYFMPSQYAAMCKPHLYSPEQKLCFAILYEALREINSWLCHEPLGCRLCSGIAAELLCENFKAHNGLGAVWGTKAAFLEHGPMVLQRHGRKQTLEDYPREWAMEYEPLEVKPADLALVKDLLKRTWR